jgi:hypothetical protein
MIATTLLEEERVLGVTSVFKCEAMPIGPQVWPKYQYHGRWPTPTPGSDLADLADLGFISGFSATALPYLGQLDPDAISWAGTGCTCALVEHRWSAIGSGPPEPGRHLGGLYR